MRMLASAMLNHPSQQETVMFRTSMFIAIALGVAAASSAATPVAASSSQVFSDHKEEIVAHVHPVNEPGRTMFRPPSKKRA
jgi:hypothetical protein